MREVERVLVDLYAAGVVLDDVEPDGEAEPRDGTTRDDAAALTNGIGQKLGDFDFYSVVFDPYERDSAPVTGSLADDLADIYRDLQAGFAELRAGRASNALREWKFGFDHHWGRHAAEAIYALYNLRSKLGG